MTEVEPNLYIIFVILEEKSTFKGYNIIYVTLIFIYIFYLYALFK